MKRIAPDDLLAIGTKVFPAYLSVCRKLQKTYWLGASVRPLRRSIGFIVATYILTSELHF